MVSIASTPPPLSKGGGKVYLEGQRPSNTPLYLKAKPPLQLLFFTEKSNQMQIKPSMIQVGPSPLSELQQRVELATPSSRLSKSRKLDKAVLIVCREDRVLKRHCRCRQGIWAAIYLP
jgi:hypothetical protein